MQSQPTLESTLSCPHCGFAAREIMQPMRASSSTNALVAMPCFGRTQVTVASSARLGQ